MNQKVKWKKLCSLITAGVLATSCAACGFGEKEKQTESTGKAETGGPVYDITEENDNQELTMNNQPESSYWFPSQLLEWNHEEDKDLEYNVSKVPLAKRADRSRLEPVNSTQNKDTNIMAISIMNGSTSGNAPHGLNKVDANTFSYWQYVDTLVYWGGSSGEGLIVAPSPDVVDAGHKNGVKVIGTIFFPQDAHGGKLEWLNEFLVKNQDGSFPMVDKLIEVAQTYGFDGWFFNQETEGTQEEPLNGEHAKLVQEFIRQFKEKAAEQEQELEMIYYDSMTDSGELDWQNALTDQNLPFIKGKDMADSMFLNFWWTEDKYAGQELLKASAQKAQENGIDPYSLYAGVDVQSDGYVTPIRWDLFEKPEKGTYTSLGIYCPNWAYTSASDMEDFWSKENTLWVNSKGDPSAELSYSSSQQWRGVSTYAVERTAITELPFVTNFSTGNGYSFFKEGKQISKMDWNNRSMSDILPTYRYIIEQEGENSLKAGFDVGDAWYGGNSLRLRGNMEKGKRSEIKLYSADLSITEGTVFTTTAKANTKTELSAVVTLEDGKEEVLEGSQKVGEDWTTVEFDTAALAGETVRTVSYRLSADADNSGYEFKFGNITLAAEAESKEPQVFNLAAGDKEFDEDAMYAGVRMSWKSDEDAAFYEIYRINQDKSRSFLGTSNTNCFYVNTLKRTDDTNKSVFEVVPVTNLQKEGISAQINIEWPDNSIPKAACKADKTLIAPGETVKFTSACSPNTESVFWSFPGAKEEKAEGETAEAVYEKEGVYDVTIQAVNSAGKVEKTIEGYIMVTNKVSGDLQLLSRNAAAEADTFVNDSEAPAFAVDGDKTKKWCATGAAPHEITLDLGVAKTVSAVDIFHAEAGGEGADMNTKSYTILVSEDGAEFKEVTNVTKNTAGTTHDTFAPTKARYVKVIVNKPTQGSDSAARIYEIEVYGLAE